MKKVRKEQKEKREKETMMRKVFTYLWEEGVSPFQLVRNLTVFGPMLVGRVRFLLSILSLFRDSLHVRSIQADASLA